MSLQTITHLNFDGQARAALDFYASVVGGQLTVATYADFGMPAEVPGADRVVFGQVVCTDGPTDGFRIAAYDVPAGTSAPTVPGPTGRRHGTTVTTAPFFIALNGTDTTALGEVFTELAVGGTVVEEFAASAWSAGFGMLTDAFGVTWAVTAEVGGEASVQTATV